MKILRLHGLELFFAEHMFRVVRIVFRHIFHCYSPLLCLFFMLTLKFLAGGTPSRVANMQTALMQSCQTQHEHCWKTRT